MRLVIYEAVTGSPGDLLRLPCPDDSFANIDGLYKSKSLSPSLGVRQGCADHVHMPLRLAAVTLIFLYRVDGRVYCRELGVP